MATTKFFHQLAKPLRVFINMRAPKRNAEAERQLTLTFRITLDGNLIRSAPKFVQSAYEEVTSNGANNVDLEREIDKVDVLLYTLPEHKKPSFKLPALHFASLAVKKVKNSEGDITTVLTFAAEYPWDKAVWEYLGDNYASDVFAKFDSAQAQLVEVEQDEEGGKKKGRGSRALAFPDPDESPEGEDEEEPEGEDQENQEGA